MPRKRFYGKLSDEFNTHQVLEDVQRLGRIEYRRIHGGVASLHNTATSCDGFMSANPNDQISFACETGLMPKDSGR